MIKLTAAMAMPTNPNTVGRGIRAAVCMVWCRWYMYIIHTQHLPVNGLALKGPEPGGVYLGGKRIPTSCYYGNGDHIVVVRPHLIIVDLPASFRGVYPWQHYQIVIIVDTCSWVVQLTAVSTFYHILHWACYVI